MWRPQLFGVLWGNRKHCRKRSWDQTIESLGFFRWFLGTGGRDRNEAFLKKPRDTESHWLLLALPLQSCILSMSPNCSAPKKHTPRPTRESEQLKCPSIWESCPLRHQRELNSTELYCSHLFCLKKKGLWNPTPFSNFSGKDLYCVV